MKGYGKEKHQSHQDGVPTIRNQALKRLYKWQRLLMWMSALSLCRRRKATLR